MSWGSRVTVPGTNRRNKLIGKASDVVGMQLDFLTAVSGRRMLSSLQTMTCWLSTGVHLVMDLLHQDAL